MGSAIERLVFAECCWSHLFPAPTGQVSPTDRTSTAAGNAVLYAVKSLFPDVKNRNFTPFSPIESEQQRGYAVQLDIIKCSFTARCFESCSSSDDVVFPHSLHITHARWRLLALCQQTCGLTAPYNSAPHRARMTIWPLVDAALEYC